MRGVSASEGGEEGEEEKEESIKFSSSAHTQTFRSLISTNGDSTPPLGRSPRLRCKAFGHARQSVEQNCKRIRQVSRKASKDKQPKPTQPLTPKRFPQEIRGPRHEWPRAPVLPPRGRWGAPRGNRRRGSAVVANASHNPDFSFTSFTPFILFTSVSILISSNPSITEQRLGLVLTLTLNLK